MAVSIESRVSVNPESHSRTSQPQTIPLSILDASVLRYATKWLHLVLLGLSHQGEYPHTYQRQPIKGPRCLPAVGTLVNIKKKFMVPRKGPGTRAPEHEPRSRP